MVRVVVVGLGPIGIAIAQAIRAERDLQLVGLVDVDANKIGRTLADLTNEVSAPSDAPSPRVVDSIEQAVTSGADVAVLTTFSHFDQVAPTLRELLKHQLAVVSSCEQLLWPWYQHPALADQIDAEAKHRGRAILGTGVNPGFVMDALPVYLSTMFRRVKQVRCIRRVDASLRRRPLQAKVGATMTPEKFMQLAGEGKIGHMGLPESVAMLAAGLGEQVASGSVKQTIEPVIATTAINSAIGLIEPGCVTGLHQVAQWENERLNLHLDLTMAVGLDNPKDVVQIEGPVQIHMKIPGGLPGDSATVAALLNHIRIVHESQPGLRTLLDVFPAGCRGKDR